MCIFVYILAAHGAPTARCMAPSPRTASRPYCIVKTRPQWILQKRQSPTISCASFPSVSLPNTVRPPDPSYHHGTLVSPLVLPLLCA